MTATNDASFNTGLSAEQKAHETSMDDILASIRRIIADDDALPLSRRARAEAAAQPNAAVPAIRTARVADAFVSLGQRLSRRAAPAEPEAAPPVALAAKPPMLKLRRIGPAPDPALEVSEEVSDEEVSSSQKIAPDQAASIQVPPPQPSPASPPLELRPSLVEAEKPVEPPSASVVTLVQPSPQAVEARFKIASLAFRAPAFAPAPERAAIKPGIAEPAFKTQDHAQARSPDAVALNTRAEPVETPPAVQAPPAAYEKEQPPAAYEKEPPPAVDETSEPALLSPASGARVGASFEALAETLLLRDPRMIERLTREMLRPMLKEWLDDHLPEVVEKLVRAEIERVARGRG